MTHDDIDDLIMFIDAFVKTSDHVGHSQNVCVIGVTRKKV